MKIKKNLFEIILIKKIFLIYMMKKYNLKYNNNFIYKFINIFFVHERLIRIDRK